MATANELLQQLRAQIPTPRQWGQSIRGGVTQDLPAALAEFPNTLRTGASRALLPLSNRVLPSADQALGAVLPGAREFWQGLTGTEPAPDGVTRAIPAGQPLATPALPAAPVRTPGPSTRPRAVQPQTGLPAPTLDTDVLRVAAPALPTPARPAPAPERQTAFDVSNSQRYMIPNQNTATRAIPASLAAPAWGAGAQPVAPQPTGPQVISVGNSGWMPDGALRPGSRNFNPVAFRAAARMQALNNQMALGQLNAATQLDVANIGAGAQLNAAQIGAGADMSRAALAAQAALQERLLANQGALATADLTGQYNLAGRQAGATGTIEAARLAANARAYAAQLGADPEGDAAQAALRAAQANEILTRLGLVQQAREAGGYSLHDLAALSRSGQQSNATPILDATGNVVGLMGPGGAIPLDENTDLGAYLRLRAVEQQLQTRR